MVLSRLSPVEYVIQNLITSISLVCVRGTIATYINYSMHFKQKYYNSYLGLGYIHPFGEI